MAPTAAPSVGINSTAIPVTARSDQGSSSDSTPLVAGVVSAVAVVALIALAVLLKRRRTSKQKNPQPPMLLPIHDDNILENGGEQPPDARPPASAVLAVGNGGDNSPSHQYDTSTHRHIPAEADGVGGGGVDGGDNAPSSALSALAVPGQLSTERSTGAIEDCGAGLAGEDTADSSAEKSLTTTAASVTTSSTADVSTHERAELAQFHQRQSASSIASEPQPEDASGDSEAPSAADRRKSGGDIGLGHAVLAAAQELAHQCQVPGISEAAAVVCIMANLVTDNRESDRAGESRLRQCRSFVTVLKRAEKVVAKVRAESAGLSILRA